MRLIVVLMTFLLFVGFMGFVLTNLDTRVAVTVWKTQYPELPLFVVVIVAVFAGILYAGIIGVAEGGHIRFANHRLARELRRLETELNYLRTQPGASSRPEPDAVRETGAPPPAEETGTKRPTEPPVAAAPVYGGENGWSSDDDDVYTGGRAV